MNVKYINPFLTATKDITTQVLGVNPIFAKPTVISPPLDLKDLIIMIGVTGEMIGKVMVNIDRTSCINIASQMMGGMPAEFNEITKSAVSEFCNMIAGTTATLFSQDGVAINITSPTVFEGSSIKISQKEEFISIPVSISQEIYFTVNISSEKKVA